LSLQESAAMQARAGALARGRMQQDAGAEILQLRFQVPSMEPLIPKTPTGRQSLAAPRLFQVTGNTALREQRFMIKWVPRAISRMGELLPAPQSSIRRALVQSANKSGGHTLSVNAFAVSALSPALRSRCKKNARGKTADHWSSCRLRSIIGRRQK
jgi:hypothetical protein